MRIKIKLSLTLFILLSFQLNAQPVVTDIYTVQQDPSLQGKEVAIVGIVTARTGIFDVRRTFMSDADGGAWSGIALWDASASLYVEEGDRIRVIGVVSENNGLTEIVVGSFYKFSSGNPLPNVEVVNTSDLSTGSSEAESFESVLVKVKNVSVIQDSLGEGEWLVDDGSGACRIDDDADNLLYDVPEIGTEIAAIIGILYYSNNNFKVEPRYRSDIADGDTSSIYTIPQVKQNSALIGDTVTVQGVVTVATGVYHPNETFIEEPDGGSFSGILIYDSTATLNANEGDALRITGTLYVSDGMMGILVHKNDILSIGNPLPQAEVVTTNEIASEASNSELFEGVLVRINDVYISEDDLGDGEWEVSTIEGACTDLNGFTIIGNDAADISFEIPITGTPLSSISGILVYDMGSYKLQPRYLSDIETLPTMAIGDTLTLIQQPLINIPAIIQSGDTLNIVCDLLESPSGWSAFLLSEDYEVGLVALSQAFDSDRQLWILKSLIPENIAYRLYDLKLEILGGETDISRNAVNVIQSFRDDFYFIHITDTHLPTHYFCRDDNFEQDSSEIADLREVMKDIELINPEFVLHTGDLINEGELEDLFNFREFTKAKNLLSEFKVPLYLVPGNHDLGGWNATPMSDGTARRNWWRFFGWKYLDKPGGLNPPFSQDYSFNYGQCQFIGLEAYLNYDGWRPDIYGGESFLESQLDWLENEVNNLDDSLLKILFYHYDFNNSLDLGALGIDLALWGHTHSNSGSIDTPPFFLSTEACSDGRRAFRLIRVSGGTIIPSPTLRSGDNGENLDISFAPANNGTNYIVTATITNNFDEQFEHARVRFLMPKDGINPQVSAGTILQVDDAGVYAVYHVELDILPSSSQSITLSVYSPSSGPYAEDCTIDRIFYMPNKDTLSVISNIINPQSQSIYVNAIIKSTDQSVADTVRMHDDGLHEDNSAGDGLYGGYWPVGVEEKDFMVHISTITQDSVYNNLLSDGAKFTTIGPVVFDSVYIAQQVGDRSRVRLLLRNDGSITTASNITAELKTNNPQITIEDNFRTFSDIGPGQTEQSLSFYSFITQTLPDSVNVTIDIFSDNQLFWTDRFTLSYLTLTLSDISHPGPLVFELQQNYPNPFNPATTIEFSLPTTEFVNLRVYDSVGKEVARLINEQVPPGNYKYTWDASDFASGVYYYKIEAGNYTQSRRLILLK